MDSFAQLIGEMFLVAVGLFGAAWLFSGALAQVMRTCKFVGDYVEFLQWRARKKRNASEVK